MSSQIFDWKQFARHSFSLFRGIRLSPQTNKTIDLTASLFLAEQWAITEIRWLLDSVLTYYLLPDVLLYGFKNKTLKRVSVNWSNIWISKAYFPANKMNCIKSEREIAKNSNFLVNLFYLWFRINYSRNW